MGNFDKDSDSSFSYTSFFGGCKLLVIVPHQDDEINVAGSTIIGSIEEGLDVSLAFMTNGDWEYDVPLRNNEAIDAAKILGLSSKNIYFLIIQTVDMIPILYMSIRIVFLIIEIEIFLGKFYCRI